MTGAMTRRKVMTISFAVPVLLLSMRKGQAANSGQTHAVTIQDMAYSPARIAVAAGDRVQWTNADLAPHTATATDGSWTSPRLKQGGSFVLDVTEGMTGTYKCKFHPRMAGEIAL